MERPRRWPRFALIGLLVLAGVAVALLRTLHAWSPSLVQPEIERALGRGVSLKSASVGVLGDTTITGLSVPDPGHHQPQLTARRASTDVSVFGNRAPSRITLEHGRLRLRFDKDGNLLSVLPSGTGGGAVPLLDIRDLSVELAQDGRDPFVLHGVNFTTRRGDGGADQISGTIHDPTWGTFQLAGSLRVEPPELVLDLSRKDAVLDPKLFRSIPFIPPAVWDLIEARGKASPVRVKLRLTEAAPYVRYEVDFAKVSLALQQKDRPAFPVESAQGKIVGDGVSGFMLVGKLYDRDWGMWNASVGMTAKDGAVTIKLDGGLTSVTPAKLRTLPFVPLSVWKQVQVSATTPAQVQVRLSTLNDRVSYRVALQPTDATVHVSSIGLDINNASGNVIIEDGRLTLGKVVGTAATGTVDTSAELDFRETATRMHFVVAVKRLDIASLPTKWDLNKKLGGKVSGKADLRLTVRQGKLETRGTGKGRIEEATLGGFKTSAPIELELTSVGDGYRIMPRMPTLGRLLFGGFTMIAAPPPPPVRLPPSPAGLAATLANGLTNLATLAAGATGQALDALTWLDRVSRPAAPATYLSANFAMENVDLAELGKRFGTALPAGVAGKVDVKVQARIPLNNAGDSKAYLATGEASTMRLVLGGVALKDVKAKVAYADGVARIVGLSARVPSRGATGTVNGTARAVLFPPGDLSLGLELSGVPLDAVERGASGQASGKLSVAVPLNKAGDLAAWRGLGRLQVDGLSFNGVAVQDATADLAVAAGTLLASDVKARVLGATVTGTAGLNLQTPYRYTATVRTAGLDLSKPPLGVPELKGSVEASGKLGGVMGALPTGQGKVKASSLSYAGVKAGPFSVEWKLASDRVSLVGLEGSLEGGKLTGQASLPLAAESTGEVRLKLAGVGVHNLVRLAPGLKGTINADLKASLKTGKNGTPVLADLDTDLTGSKLSIAGVPLTKLKASAKLHEGKFSYKVSADALGGQMKVEGEYPPPPPPLMGPVSPRHGRLLITGVRLRALARLGSQGGRVPLGGALRLDLPFRHKGPRGLPAGNGRFELRGLSYGGKLLAEPIRGEVRLHEGSLSLREAMGNLLGGELRMRGTYRPGDLERSWIDLTLSGADSSRLVGLAGAEKYMRGAVDIHLRGRLGREWVGSGKIRMPRGSVAGVQLTDWNVPLDFTYAPSRGHGEIHVRDSGAHLGGGRARLRGDVSWGESARVEARIRFHEASLKSLSGMLGDVSTYARGRLTGSVDIGGSDVRTAEDLTAEVRGQLSDAQALKLPILSLLTPYMGPGQSATVFQSGEVRGRLSRGVFRFERLTLESSVAQLIITGNTTTKGRLDLNVLARTSILGRGNNPAARALLLRIPLAGPLPIGLIVQVAVLLSDRIIHLKVSGTTSHPVVRAQPLRLITDTLGRLLLDRLLMP